MTGVISPDTAVTDRESDRLFCPIFGVTPVGYDQVCAAETAELERERIRLWYVAATRARELLVVPRLDAPARRSAWISLLDLSISDLPALDLSHLPAEISGAIGSPPNDQSRVAFVREAAEIASRERRLTWLAPSRDEGADGPLVQAEIPAIIVSGDDSAPADGARPSSVQGGRQRGLVIHRLLEEVLTGETADDLPVLTDRASALIQALGQPIVDDPAKGLSAAEIAGCVSRTMALPEIAALRPTLVPEFPVYASAQVGDIEQATAGITDATSLAPDGTPQAVIDWKSDVNPAPESIEHYCAQVRSYLATIGTKKGLVVFVTPGVVVSIGM